MPPEVEESGTPAAKVPPQSLHGGEDHSQDEESSGPNEKQELEAPDESSWDEKTRKYIQSLRREAATYRTKSKDHEGKARVLEDERRAIAAHLRAVANGGDPDAEDLSPEEQVQHLAESMEQLNLRLALSESARVNGITSQEDFDYFEFCLGKQLEELGEDGELSDERMAEIVQEVRSRSKGAAGAGTTSVSAPKGAGGNAPNAEVTLAQFANMTMTERSLLYERNKTLYNTLFAEAKTKNLL